MQNERLQRKKERKYRGEGTFQEPFSAVGLDWSIWGMVSEIYADYSEKARRERMLFELNGHTFAVQIDRRTKKVQERVSVSYRRSDGLTLLTDTQARLIADHAQNLRLAFTIETVKEDLGA